MKLNKIDDNVRNTKIYTEKDCSLDLEQKIRMSRKIVKLPKSPLGG